MMESWYCIRSKPNKEEFLWGQLVAREFEVFYPRLRVKPVNPRASKIRPYFPGYMFVYLDLAEIGTNALQWMPGALGLVSFGSEPAQVPNGLVQAIRRRTKALNNGKGKQLRGLKRGDLLVIQEGPFEGYQALFDAYLPGEERVRVFLSLLRDQQVKLVLPAKLVERKIQH
jgi:transcription antitermination factor NusG